MSLITLKDHNQCAFLDASRNARGFEDVLEFLSRSQLNFALTADPTIYKEVITEFWNSAKVSDDNQISGSTMGFNVQINEDVIRQCLQFRDNAEDPTNVDPDSIISTFQLHMGYTGPWEDKQIFKGMLCPRFKYLVHIFQKCLSPRRTGWNNIPLITSGALACFIMSEPFNFSKYILIGMMSNLKKQRWFMYPRFLQLIINSTVQNIVLRGPVFKLQAFDYKIFGQMKRDLSGYNGDDVPLGEDLIELQTDFLQRLDQGGEAEGSDAGGDESDDEEVAFGGGDDDDEEGDGPTVTVTAAGDDDETVAGGGDETVVGGDEIVTGGGEVEDETVIGGGEAGDEAVNFEFEVGGGDAFDEAENVEVGNQGASNMALGPVQFQEEAQPTLDLVVQQPPVEEICSGGESDSSDSVQEVSGGEEEEVSQPENVVETPVSPDFIQSPPPTIESLLAQLQSTKRLVRSKNVLISKQAQMLKGRDKKIRKKNKKVRKLKQQLESLKKEIQHKDEYVEKVTQDIQGQQNALNRLDT